MQVNYPEYTCIFHGVALVVVSKHEYACEYVNTIDFLQPRSLLWVATRLALPC